MSDLQDLDQYGGWKKITGQKTGFFHLEFINGRWWFVDPEGYVFISVGINHMWRDLLRRPYNRHIFDEKYGTLEEYYSQSCILIKTWGFNTVGEWTETHDMLQKIKPKLVYGVRLNVLPISIWETWNIAREGSKKIKERGIVSRTVQGNIVHDNIYRIYFEDIFEDKWEDYCKSKIGEICKKHRDDPYLLGYYGIDIPLIPHHGGGKTPSGL